MMGAAEYVTGSINPLRPDWVFDDRSPSRPCMPCQAKSRCSDLSSSTEVGLISIVCPVTCAVPANPPLVLTTAPTKRHCAEQGHGQGNSGRDDVERAKGVGERAMASSTRGWDGGAGNRQGSWMLECPAGVQRRSNRSSVTNAGKRRVKETVRGSQNNGPVSRHMSHVT